MTEHHTPVHTVTVPVGVGGKSAPFVADPAPTVLIELALLDVTEEESRAADLITDAEAAAAEIVAAVHSHADDIRRTAEMEAAAIVAAAHSHADDIRRTAEMEAAEIVRTGHVDAERISGDLEARTADLDARIDAIDERAGTLEIRERELAERETSLAERLASVDDRTIEAVEALAAARAEADAIVAEARVAGETMIEDAKEAASAEAATVLDQAREAARNDPTVTDRIAEIESVHEIELRVLHEREAALLDHIVELESQLTAAAAAAQAAAEEAAEEAAHQRSFADRMAMELDSEAVMAADGESRNNGRHTSDSWAPADLGSTATITTHAPLTEQLSTSAFRTTPDKDRRGRRRR